MVVTQAMLEQLKQALFNSDQLCEQDKDLIWLCRYEVLQKYPNCLAKVLQSVKWNSFKDVAKVRRENLSVVDPPRSRWDFFQY